MRASSWQTLGFKTNASSFIGTATLLVPMLSTIGVEAFENVSPLQSHTRQAARCAARCAMHRARDGEQRMAPAQASHRVELQPLQSWRT